MLLAPPRRRAPRSTVATGPTVGTVFRPVGAADVGAAVLAAPRRRRPRPLDLDAGAVAAVVQRRASLLPAGINGIAGEFVAGDPVDLVGPDGAVVARGLVGFDAAELPALFGKRSRDLPPEQRREVVHPDDLVLLVAARTLFVHRWRIRVGATSAARWPGWRGRSRSPRCSASDSGATPTWSPLPLPAVVFRTLKLFTFSLDVPSGKDTPPQLWWALFLGGAVTARGLAALFRDRLSGVLTAYVAGPGSSSSGRTAGPRRSSRRRRTGLVAGCDRRGGSRSGRARHHHRTADPEGAGHGHQRGVADQSGGAPRCFGGGRDRRPRADFLDHHAGHPDGPPPAPPSPLLRLSERLIRVPPRTRLDVFVEVSGFGLAGILEQGGRPAGVEITPFSPPARAMAAALDAVEADRRRRVCLRCSPRGPTTAVDGGAVRHRRAVDAAALDLYRRRPRPACGRGAARAPGAALRAGRPGAARGVGRVARHRPAVLEIEAIDVELGQLVELDMATARRLARHRPRQVFVLVPTDPESGIAVALTHLGRDERLVLVNESPLTPIADEIVRQADASPLTSSITLVTMPQQVYPLAALQRERRADRPPRLCPTTAAPRTTGARRPSG